MIGALDRDGKGYKRHGAPRGETEDKIGRKFANSSSYQMTFSDFGRMPEANKRPSKGFQPGYGKLDGLSAYQTTYANKAD